MKLIPYQEKKVNLAQRTKSAAVLPVSLFYNNGTRLFLLLGRTSAVEKPRQRRAPKNFPLRFAHLLGPGTAVALLEEVKNLRERKLDTPRRKP